MSLMSQVIVAFKKAFGEVRHNFEVSSVGDNLGRLFLSAALTVLYAFIIVLIVRMLIGLRRLPGLNSSTSMHFSLAQRVALEVIFWTLFLPFAFGSVPLLFFTYLMFNYSIWTRH